MSTKTNRRTFLAQEFSELTGLGLHQVYRAIKRGDVKAKKIGKTWLIPASELDRICAEAASA